MPDLFDQDPQPGSTHDPVNSPTHYRSHPSGIECIEITEHLGFCLGSAVKYLWRIDHKGSPIENLEKARWYINREIDRRRRLSGLTGTAPRPTGGGA